MNSIMIISKTNLPTIQTNNSRLLFTDTDSLMYETETQNFYDGFSNKEMFDFSNYSAKSKYCDDLNALVVGKMKGEMGGVVIAHLVGFRPKISSILVIDSKEYRKAKCVNKDVDSKVSHNEYKDVFIHSLTSYFLKVLWHW